MHPFSLTEEEIVQVTGAASVTNPDGTTLIDGEGGMTVILAGDPPRLTTVPVGEEGGVPEDM